MTALRAALRRVRGNESGITLIELLVAMAMGVIVSGAAYAILTTTLRETSRVFTRVDATQRSRLAMENIESLLHSSCVADGTTPIISTPPSRSSDGTNMWFVSKYGNQNVVTPTLHKLSLNTTTKTLTDSTYALTAGTSPQTWTWATTATGTTTVLTNVTQVGSTPIFRYFKFEAAKDSSGQPYEDDSGNPLQMLMDGTNSLPTGTFTSSGTAVAAGTFPANSPDPLPVPLSSTNAADVSEVLFNMNVGASGAGTNSSFEGTAAGADANAIITNSVVLRLTPVVTDGANNQEVAPCD